MANILATRRHKILQSRAEQIGINILAFHGGAPYIAARLSRFPSESDVDFFGEPTTNPPSIGRQERAFLINYARRIAHKINQYVFQTAVERNGADPEFLADVTATGMSVNQFMSELSSLLTVCRWGWIGIDRPMSSGPRSIAERERSGDRVYWQLYAPNEVVDWSIDARGSINWLLTETSEYGNADPRQEAAEKKLRHLWEPGRVTRMELDSDKEDFKETVETPLAIREVPFIQAGLIEDTPWWFDDLERIQRAVMDLLSSRDTQIFKSVFALLVVSEGFSKAMQIENIREAAARRKIGLGSPLIESADEKGLTRYLDTPAAVFATIKEAVTDLQAQLYEIVGLNMSVPESRQVASAEAKQWDHLDPEAVLRERATLLEEVESKAVDISAQLGGPVFKPWAPVYTKRFDISDFQADMQALTSLGGLTVPPEAEKMFMRAAVQAVGKRFNRPPEEVKAAQDAVDAYDPGADMPADEEDNTNQE